MVIRRLTIGLIAFVSAISALSAQHVFPDWTAEPLGLSGVWERASFVVVGQLRQIRPVGSVRPGKLPRIASPTIRRIYWCEGEFSSQQVIRGKLTLGVKRFLWGAIKPGCQLDQEASVSANESLTQVWFVREEGSYLRPVVDAGGPFFFTFHEKWTPQTAGADPERHFGQLLLSPRATGLTPEEYAQSFFKPAGLACWILGNADCMQRIRSLAAIDNRALHDAACKFLDYQFGEKCRQ
jgi:hypothetical protein